MKKPSETNNYFERLGINENSSQEQIKEAYRKQAFFYHPDRNQGKEKESEIEFVAISEAYEHLSGKICPDISFEKCQERFFMTFKDLAEVLSKSENRRIKKIGITLDFLSRINF